MIKDFFIAVGNYKKYGELLKNKWYRVVGYMVLLILVCSIGSVVIPTVMMGSRTLNILWEDLPEFTVTEDGMKTDGEFDLEFSGVKMFMTNKREVSQEEFGENLTGVLMDKDTVIIKNYDRMQEFAYSEFGDGFRFTKKDLVHMKPLLYMFGIILFIMLYVSYALGFVLSGMFVGALSAVIAVFMGIKLRMGEHMILGMYSQTLPYLLAAIMAPMGINPIKTVMYIISIVIIVFFFRTVNADVQPEEIKSGSDYEEQN